jgi:excinuclease ABC subunit C
MVSEAEEFSYILVSSELEALLLEAKLIRAFMPRYNTASKDDKHPLYIRITKEEYPRVITARKIFEKEDNIAFYGPFPSSKNVYSVLRMLRRIFPYSDHKIGKRACLYSHIGLCKPCPSEIVSIKNPRKRAEMKEEYKSNIRQIKSILDGKIDKVMKNLRSEMEKYSRSEQFEKASGVRDKIQKLEYITKPQIPAEFYIQNPNLVGEIRAKELKDLLSLLRRHEKPNSKVFISDSLSRIECFDVAHLAGTNPTASMVTFIDGEADKNYYRHFKIKKAKGGDDYESLREVCRRRSKYFEVWGKPDLIIVDGGVGQVAAFSGVLKNKNIKIPVVGIAKHPDRLIIGKEKIKLSGPSLNLVSRMRDEAHRFAQRYHHKLFAKSLIGS